MAKKEELSIAKAVENLSALAGLEGDHVVEVSGKQHLVLKKKTPQDEGALQVEVAAEQDEAMMQVIRESFRVILRYVQTQHAKTERQPELVRGAEGIKTIMILAGEAAKKFDRYAPTVLKSLEGNSAPELQEFRELQRFYRQKVVVTTGDAETEVGAHVTKLFEEVRQQRAAEYELDTASKAIEGLDAVKADTEYELFCFRREDGSPFYDLDLVRNIKHACDYGAFHGDYFSDDPLLQVKNWHDRALYFGARGIFDAVRSRADAFFREAGKFMENDFVRLVSKGLMALMMTKHGGNLLRSLAVKSCYEYAQDFLVFTREMAEHPEYQRLRDFPKQRKQDFQDNIMWLVQTLCLGVYTMKAGQSELQGVVAKMMRRGWRERENTLPFEERGDLKVTERLVMENEALIQVLKHHPNGPLFKALDFFMDELPEAFDPLHQDNVPHYLYDLYLEDRSIAHYRHASPTLQADVFHASILEEYRAFLHGLFQKEEHHCHLLVNLQNRTSMRDHARCAVLEELSRDASMSGELIVVTLSKDSDFYYQLPPYHLQDRAEDFKQGFLHQLQDDGTGYYFPREMHPLLFPDFSAGIMDAIHEGFFEGKRLLTRRERLDFIEIFYALLTLKLMEITRATSFSLTCKDAVDVGMCASGGLFFFLKVLNGQKVPDNVWEQIEAAMYAPALLIRERALLAERFQRMVNMLGCVEKAVPEGDSRAAKTVMALFDPFFETPMLAANPFIAQQQEGF